MGKKRNIHPIPVTPNRVKIEIKDEIGNCNFFYIKSVIFAFADT